MAKFKIVKKLKNYDFSFKKNQNLGSRFYNGKARLVFIKLRQKFCGSLSVSLMQTSNLNLRLFLYFYYFFMVFYFSKIPKRDYKSATF